LSISFLKLRKGANLKENDLLKIRNTIEKADAILVFAGAGMSADSNLTTYRDKEGFWNDFPLYRELKKSYVSMMSYQGLLDDPHFAWGYFAHQYSLYNNAVPHEGYNRLLELCQSKEDYFIVTTNVDGLFKKVGFSVNKVHEVHGSIHKLQCSMPCERSVWDTEGLHVEIDYSTMKALDNLPLCSKCGFVSRPNICMYGDTDESYVWEAAHENAKRFKAWRKKHIHKIVLIFEIGVGAEGLKRHLVEYRKEFADATLICINPYYDDIQNDAEFNVSMRAKDAFMSFSKNRII